MALSWLPARSGDVGALIARKSYARAAKLLRERLEEDPENVTLALQLADVLELDGQVTEAVGVLVRAADGYARGGFVAKAIALLKKVQRLDPERGADLDRQIADLAKERDAETERRRALREAISGRFRPPASAAPGPASDAEEALTEAAAGDDAAEIDLSSLDEPETEPETAPEPEAAPPENTLERTPLFSGFSADELVEVIRGLRLLTYTPGDVVVAEGEPGDSLFVISTGSVKAFCHDPRGEYRKVRELGEGEFFGEVSILTGSPRTATVTAAAPLELLELDLPTLESIAAERPHVVTVLEDISRARAGSLEELRVRMGRTAPPPAPSAECRE